MVIVHATLPIKADAREAFLAAVPALIEASNAEEGCISYRLFESAETPNSFLMVEQYADQAAMEAHLKSPHLGGAAQHLGEWLSGPPQIISHNAEDGVEVKLG